GRGPRGGGEAGRRLQGAERPARRHGNRGAAGTAFEAGDREDRRDRQQRDVEAEQEPSRPPHGGQRPAHEAGRHPVHATTRAVAGLVPPARSSSRTRPSSSVTTIEQHRAPSSRSRTATAAPARGRPPAARSAARGPGPRVSGSPPGGTSSRVLTPAAGSRAAAVSSSARNEGRW